MSRALPIAAAGLAAGLTLGVWLEGLRLGAAIAELRTTHAQQMQQIAETSAQVIAEQQQRRLGLESQLQQIDTTHYEELTSAQSETDRLAAELRATRRLSVRASCPAAGVPAAPGTAGVDAGSGARVFIHPDTAQDIVRVTGRADECRARLTALQAWAREISK